MELIFKLFIKDKDNVESTKVRCRYGQLSGAMGIFLNCVLFIIKLVAGLITSSVGVMADAFNNLSDAGASIITLVGFKMAGKPADKDHPFGHGRMEYLCSLFVSVAILIMGYELFKASFDKANRTSINGARGVGFEKGMETFDEIKKLIENNQAVYIITPEQFSFTAEKNLMETCNRKAVLKAEVITFGRIAYRIINEIGGINNEPISNCGKAMILINIIEKQKENGED